jgi:hypothetical protein
LTVEDFNEDVGPPDTTGVIVVVMFTVPANVLMLVTFSVDVALEPAGMARVAGLAETRKSGLTTVKLKVRVWNREPAVPLMIAE